jgi:serine/threonine protein kinase
LIVALSDFTFGPKDQIGSGSFGEVFRASDTRTGREVAIKLVRVADMDENARQLFRREVEVIASVDHHTLLCCRGYVPIESGTPALVTDYARSGSFGKLLEKVISGEVVPYYDDTVRLKILYGIAVGMMILHQQRIIHRDLKPDNVLLGEQLEPRVADFGLSKFVAKGKTKLQSVCCGTPVFMAPEIFTGECDFDFSVDVYAYGILLYITIAKRDVDYGPGALNEYAVGHRVLAGKRPTIPPDTDPAWADLIEACWAQSRELRPTFEQIVAALGSPTFVTERINAAQFREYQDRTMPSGNQAVTFAPSAGPLK